MLIPDEKLKELFVLPGHLSEEEFGRIAKEAGEKKLTTLDLIIERGILKDEQVGRVIAEDIGVPFVNLRNEKIDESTLHVVPETVARSRRVIAFARSEDGVKVGFVDPRDYEMEIALEKRFEAPIQKYYITERDFSEAVRQYRGSLEEEFRKILVQYNASGTQSEERDQAIVRMADLILEHGHSSKASDIHI